MEVLYYIVGHILWGYSLKLRPKKLAKNIWNRYLRPQSDPEEMAIEIFLVVVSGLTLW